MLGDFTVESRSAWLCRCFKEVFTGVAGWRGFTQEVKGCRGMGAAGEMSRGGHCCDCWGMGAPLLLHDAN